MRSLYVNVDNKFIFSILACSHPHLAEVIREAVGHPTPEKLQNVLESYQASGHILVGCFSANTLIGVMGFIEDKDRATLKHIAILKPYRCQGIGKKFIQIMRESFSFPTVEAETDEEGVGFYRKCGFSCTAFEKKHGRRYHCTLSFG